jgi:2'-5' RNA ligase
MHLTIRFIGEVDAAAAARIQAALAPPLPVAPFDVTVGEAGAFPPKGPPRVLWVGIGAGQEGLLAVEGHVSARLEGCGVPRESRPFSPHLTLARVRDAGGLRARDLFTDQRDPRRPDAPGSPTNSRVDAITLFQSRLSPNGPAYVPLQHTPLRG